MGENMHTVSVSVSLVNGRVHSFTNATGFERKEGEYIVRLDNDMDVHFPLAAVIMVEHQKSW
jgi:hypothetical protein